MKRLLCMILFPVLSIKAQERGIKFEEGLSWNLIKAKAKTENKYIFIDCYATWCGPCKWMDKTVYSNDSVGDAVNNKFVSVKIQMDTGKTDPDAVRMLYPTARAFEKQFSIVTLPTFLFFSPEGNVLHKDMGARNSKEFLAMTTDALHPDRQYYKLIEKWRNGKLGFAAMPAFAKKVKDYYREDSLSMAIAKDYIHNYLDKLSNDEFYTKNNLEFLVAFVKVIGSGDKVFNVFFQQQMKVDSILASRGISKQCVDDVIYREEINPIIKPAANNGGTEPDWKKMAEKISKKFGPDYSKRTVLFARVWYYQKIKNWEKYTEYLVQKVEQFNSNWGIAAINTLNNSAFEIFNYSNKKSELEKALVWIDRAIILFQKPEGGMLDTKANLLYKLGRKKEAILLEEKAVALEPRSEDIRVAFEKMKKDLPTWINE